MPLLGAVAEDVGHGDAGDAQLLQRVLQVAEPLLVGENRDLGDLDAGGLVVDNRDRLVVGDLLDRRDIEGEVLVGGQLFGDRREVGVGDVAVFADVEALELLFGRNPDAGRLFEDQPDRPGRHEGENADGEDAEDLDAQQAEAAAEEEAVPGREGGDPLLGEEADAEGAEDAAAEVDGSRADRVVDMEFVKEQDREDDQHAGQGADNHRGLDRDVGAAAGDGDQPGEAAVDGHAEVGFAHRNPGGDGGGEDGDNRRGVGGHQDVEDVFRVLEAHRRAGVEPEPAQPEDKQADNRQRHAVAGDGLRLAVLAVLADAGPEDDRARQCRPAAEGMDGGIAGEVHEPEVGKPAAAPDPVADHRVDEEGQDEGEDDKRHILDPFGHRPRDDRRGGAAEDQLEEEFPPERDRRSQRPVIEGVVSSAEDEEVFGAGEGVVAPEHQSPPQEHKPQRGDGEYDEVFGKDVDGVLRPRKARFHTGKAEVHEEDQDGCKQHPQGVDDGVFHNVLPPLKENEKRTKAFSVGNAFVLYASDYSINFILCQSKNRNS